MDHWKAIEAAAKARYEQWWRGFTPEEQEYIRQGIRKEVAAFLRAVEPSDSVTAAGFTVHPCHPGETKVSDSMRAMCRALAEEIADELEKQQVTQHQGVEQ